MLDDGFQHRRLKRDLDLVLLKKEDIRSLVLPLGRLREPLSQLKRANAIILAYQEIDPFDFVFNDIPVFKMFRKNWRILNSRFEEISPTEKDFIAFCGLGDNVQFLKVLKKLGVRIKEFIAFPDHHDYSDFKLHTQENYLTTLKDFIKLPYSDNLFFLDFEVEVEGLKAFILKKLKCCDE